MDCWLCQILSLILLRISLAEARYGLKRAGADIIRKRLLNAHSWLLKSDSFFYDVKDVATK